MLTLVVMAILRFLILKNSPIAPNNTAAPMTRTQESTTPVISALLKTGSSVAIKEPTAVLSVGRLVGDGDATTCNESYD